MTLLERTFTSTTQGLKRKSLPMRLFAKAKKLGTWDPADIDFSQDKIDWMTLNDDERDLVLRLTSLFQGGEEAVTLDILPLIMVMAEEGRVEEELFLTTFLFEEAKHTDFFDRFLREVVEVSDDLSHYQTPNYRYIFHEALPSAMRQLKIDPSPRAQVQASATYNMIVEGMLAETGYHAYFTALERQNLLPGQRQGIQLLKRDESRHIAYGVYLLSRLIAADDELWDHLEATMNELLMPAMGIISDAFAQYDPMPFGLQESDFMDYALQQFQKRMNYIERARSKSATEVLDMADSLDVSDNTFNSE
ncbi:MAG: R2-like ligand-binding oxidase [Chloroflexota bacterium]